MSPTISPRGLPAPVIPLGSLSRRGSGLISAQSLDGTFSKAPASRPSTTHTQHTCNPSRPSSSSTRLTNPSEKSIQNDLSFISSVSSGLSNKSALSEHFFHGPETSTPLTSPISPRKAAICWTGSEKEAYDTHLALYGLFPLGSSLAGRQSPPGRSQLQSVGSGATLALPTPDNLLDTMLGDVDRLTLPLGNAESGLRPTLDDLYQPQRHKRKLSSKSINQTPNITSAGIANGINKKRRLNKADSGLSYTSILSSEDDESDDESFACAPKTSSSPRYSFSSGLSSSPTPQIYITPIPPHETARLRIAHLLSRQERLRQSDCLPPGILQSKGSPVSANGLLIFGIERELRNEIVIWLFDVLPPPESKSGRDLREHLLACRESRIDAVNLFSRYMLRVGGAMPNATEAETPYMLRSRRRLIWDVALACLALSVKFHHDFLHPLYPIHTKAFFTIARHRIGILDFEACQQDVLEALSFSVWGINSNGLIEDIWDALPTLQALFPRDKRPWSRVLSEVASRLQMALYECDMLRFPTSLIILTALLQGIAFVVSDCGIDHYEPASTLSASQLRSLSHLKEGLTAIERDLKALLSVRHGDLKTCMDWLERACEEADGLSDAT